MSLIFIQRECKAAKALHLNKGSGMVLHLEKDSLALIERETDFLFDGLRDRVNNRSTVLRDLGLKFLILIPFRTRGGPA